MNHQFKIENKEEFLHFIEILLNDFKENNETWENNNLEDYLEAIGRWVEDMDGYYQNTNQQIPSDINWKVFSDILIAAKMYE